MLRFIILLHFSFFIMGNGFAYDKHKINLKKELFFKNRRAKFPLGVNVLLLGPADLIGGSVDYFISPKINVELGIGINNDKAFKMNYYSGLKYHLLGNTFTNTTFYAGGFFKNDFDNSTDKIIQELYLPIGLQKIHKNQFSWNIELAYRYNIENSKSIVWGALKLGYRFKLTKSKLNL